MKDTYEIDGIIFHRHSSVKKRMQVDYELVLLILTACCLLYLGYQMNVLAQLL